MPTKKTDEPIALLSLTEILHPQEKWQTDGSATVLGTTASTPCHHCRTLRIILEDVARDSNF